MACVEGPVFQIQMFHYGCPNQIIIDLIQDETISLNVGRPVGGPVGGVGRPQPPVLRGHQKFLLGAAEAAQSTTQPATPTPTTATPTAAAATTTASTQATTPTTAVQVPPHPLYRIE